MKDVAIIYSLYKHWTNMILDNQKPIEFRTKLPKNLQIGSKIYLYETKKHGGYGAVVGECTVESIIPMLREDGAWPIVGCYPFIEYYLRNVKKDIATADYVHKIQEEFRCHPNYRYGFITSYMFSEDELNSLRTTGRLLDLFSYNLMNKEDEKRLIKLFDDKDKAQLLEDECDKWLESIGLYDDGGETIYKYGIVLNNVVKYDSPVPINSFVGLNGAAIETAPQSFCYSKKKISVI